MAMPKILIITCADPRCVPEQLLGLRGAEAAVFRNVCGHVGAEMHHILALDTLINFNEIMIVHHNGELQWGRIVGGVSTEVHADIPHF